MQKYNSRKDVPEKYKWDLNDFYKNEEEFDKDYQKCEENIEKLSKYKGCTKDSNKLYEFLILETQTIALWENLYVYSHLINDQELGVRSSIERKSSAINLNAKLTESISFFEPELLSLNKEEYEKLFKYNEKLLEFKADLDQTYREKEHILTENEEIIVSNLVNAMDHFEDMASNLINSEHDYGKVLVDNEETTIATNNYGMLMRNKDAKVRHTTRDSYQKVLDQYSESNASYLNGYVAMLQTIAKIHHFDSSWDRKLFSLNLNDKVFKTLVETTENNLDVLQKYFDLKRRVLKIDELTQYDTALEISKSNKKYSIEEAQDIIRNSLKPLGEDYLSKFDKIINNHYIDYCQYKGKCSGGYSFNTMTHDSRILMSYNENFDSVSTIAHEGGHNIHSQYLKENNPMQYREQPVIVCEVASLTNECLLSSYLAKNGKTKEEKLTGIANIMSVIASNLYGAVREGKMEQDFHKYVLDGNTITKEYMDELAYNSLKKYYGASVKLDDYSKNDWVTRSHYFANFYLYSYAICISVAASNAKKILSGDKEHLNRYIEFLKTGGDKWPQEVFNVLGVDLEDPSVYKNAIDYFDELIATYESISKEG